MHSNIYSYLFCATNIKQEHIIDSHAAWTEANVVTTLQIKEFPPSPLSNGPVQQLFFGHALAIVKALT